MVAGVEGGGAPDIGDGAAGSEAGGESAGWSGLLLTLFVFSLVNAQFSGDVPYNSGLWLWGGLASGLAAATRAGSHYAARQRS